MAIQITDEGTNINVVINGVETRIPKEGVGIKEGNSNDVFLNAENRKTLRIPVADVTVPAVADVAALTTAVDNMVKAGSSPSASGSLTDGSGSILLASTSQQIFAANPTRKYLLVQNLAATAIYINLNSPATIDTDSIKLLADGSYVAEAGFIPTGAVNVIGAAGGEAFMAKEG